jgi:multidrug efflux pump subunit AcrA (membrane-fusion protein)
MNQPLRTPWLRRGLIALVALGVVVAAAAWFGRGKAVPVVVTAIAHGKVESTVANTRAGTVEACQRTKLSTIVGGRIEVLAVKEGDRVKKGQLLMKLWNDDQQAQQTLARACGWTCRVVRRLARLQSRPDMTKDDWLSQFADELVKLHPHLSGKFALTLALQYYSDEHSRLTTREYDQQPRADAAASPVAAKKWTK